MKKHQVETEFQQKYGNTGEPTDCTDGSSKYGRKAMYQKPGRMPTVTIYKKGDRTECDNYLGISLLSAAGKIFARILLNRLSSHITPEVMPETQCGFRSNRSTVDMIFCLRQLQEKCIEQDRSLYIVFVDFTKAFDTVGRTGLWQLMRKYECPEKFTTMMESLHTGFFF